MPIIVVLPKQKPDLLLPVIVLKLKGKPKVNATIGIDPKFTTTLSSIFAECDRCDKTELRWMKKFGEWKYADSEKIKWVLLNLLKGCKVF